MLPTRAEKRLYCKELRLGCNKESRDLRTKQILNKMKGQFQLNCLRSLCEVWEPRNKNYSGLEAQYPNINSLLRDYARNTGYSTPQSIGNFCNDYLSNTKYDIDDSAIGKHPYVHPFSLNKCPTRIKNPSYGVLNENIASLVLRAVQETNLCHSNVLIQKLIIVP